MNTQKERTVFADKTMKRILLICTAVLLALMAGCALAEEQVYTSGAYSYTLDKYGEATILTMPGPEDPSGLLLVPAKVDGHKVEALDASCFPMETDEVMMPQGCYMRSHQQQTHEFRVYWYLDYEGIRELDIAKYLPHMLVKPGEYLLTGAAYRYDISGNWEKLTQDYYLYPTSVNGAKILMETSPDSVTSYTSGHFTYFKTSPETVAICYFDDQEARKVRVPDTLDGLTVVALMPRYGWGNAIYAPRAKEIILPDTLKIIGDNAIYSEDLKELNLPEGLEEIGAYSINAYPVKKLVLPSTLKKIGPYAFNGCRSLKQVTMGAGVEEIDPTSFEDTAKKFTIVAPKGSYAESYAKENKFGFKKAK